MEQGSAQDATLLMKLLHIKEFQMEKKIFNIDKLNGVFTINGVNQLGEIIFSFKKIIITIKFKINFLDFLF
ncbi:phage major tail tube protein [Clostridium carnis]|uniref:phage major tail tube protein n=1 Tax=Clostridium carnis TaxID=1530 RepID=UPI00242A9F6D|nr:phage major tail tube protein [Clostridium carnis]